MRSPVIAAAMLKRQQAQALIQARTAIVSGAVDIATMAAFVKFSFPLGFSWGIFGGRS